MNERIKELAVQAGDDWDHTLESDKEFLKKFAEFVIADEREANKNLIHAIREAMDLLDQPEPRVHAAYGELHKAIRARGEK